MTDSKLVDKNIAEVLNIKEDPAKPIIETLIDNIKNKSLLILLDNCEHLIQACAEIADRLLQSVEGIRILATSREPLNIPGEVVWRIPSLSFPEPGSKKDIDEIQHYEAIKLFTDRAASGKPGFTLNPQNVSPVVGICQRIAGIPLVVELAATRIRHLGPEAILERLEDQFKILSSSIRTAPERQQTLKATIDWSYNLLSEQEQLLFSRLSVFAGDFSLEAVEEVCSDENLEKDNILPVLSKLVDKSLVITENQEDESIRYRYLDPLYQYSLQKLIDSKEEDKQRKSHMSYYLKMAEKAYKERLESQSEWLNLLKVEHDNMISALNWSDNQYPYEFIRLSGALSFFWWMQSHILLSKYYLERALSKNVGNSEAYARVLSGLGFILLWIDHITAINLMNDSLKIWRQFNNLEEEAYVLAELSWAYHLIKDYDTGLKCSEQSLEITKKIGNPNLINHSLSWACTSLIVTKQFDRAMLLVEELLISSEELKQPFGKLRALHYHSDCALAEKDFKKAEKRYGLAIETSLKYGDILQATNDLHGMAFSVSGQSRWVKAIRLDGAVCENYRNLGVSIAGLLEFWDEWIDTYIEGAKKELGEELTRKYEEEGRNMGFEEAVEYALDFERD